MKQINTLKIWLLGFILLSIVDLYAQNKDNNLAQYFSKLADNQRFNGNVLVAENGKIIFEKSFGYADFSNKKPNTKDARFPVASITKTFTATAIFQLQEKGKLNVNDLIIKYLVDFPYPTIAIKNLMSHTSGLPSYDKLFEDLRKQNPDTIFTNQNILPRYSTLKLPLNYQPGESWNYDNVNYIFLAIILEKVSGMSFENYLKQNIFEPAGMKNTLIPDFAFVHYSAKEKKNLSFTYRLPHLYSDDFERSDTLKFFSEYWHCYKFKGFGEMISTTQDLLKYDQALSQGKLLSEASFKQAFVPFKLNNGKNTPTGYGLGWEIEENNPYGKLVMHGGGMIGLRSILYRNISKNQVVIICDNTQNEVYGYATEALKILNGENLQAPAKSIAKEFGKILLKKGASEAQIILKKLKNDIHYSLSEGEFNSLGYDFMRDNKDNEALEVFRTNVESFPAAWNVYDSYGEILLKIGKKEEAIKMYQKSMELNPENENGKNILNQLSKANKE